MPRNIENIVDQMNRAFRGEAWHGPSLMETLEGVTAITAARRSIADAHTVWELVQHVTVWKRTVERRLNGEPIELTSAEDWPSMPNTTPENWATVLDQLRRAHESLVRTFSAFTPERLDDIVPGKDYSVYFMMLGTAQHDCYHAGQVAVVKK
jgi:uncharacterized damage-inducible protein DinB